MSKVEAIRTCRGLMMLAAAFVHEEQYDMSMGALSLLAETMADEGVMPGDIESLLVVQNPNDEDLSSEEDLKNGLFARLAEHMQEVRGDGEGEEDQTGDGEEAKALQH